MSADTLLLATLTALATWLAFFLKDFFRRVEETQRQVIEILSDQAAQHERNSQILSEIVDIKSEQASMQRQIIEILKASDFGIIASTRSTVELQNIFDSMSFNKARVLLTYWDWAVMKSGPYAPAN